MNKKIELYKLLKLIIKSRTNVEKEDLVHDVYVKFLENRYLDRYDPFKGTFVYFVKVYTGFVLGNIFCPQRKSYWTHNIKTWNLEDGYTTSKSRNPQEELLFKESLKDAMLYFTKTELDVLLGNKTCAEIARKRGVSRQYTSAQLKERISKFKV